jgi:Ca2+-binding EF-hand superfamily protein
VTAHELKKALSDDNFNIPVDEIEHIIDEVDYHGQHKINYSEFLAATIKVKDILTDDKLLAIFKQFDTEAHGKITPDNILEAMEKLGHQITAKELKETMEKYDLHKEGFLAYDEFKMVFLGMGSYDRSAATDTTSTK